MTRPPRRLVGTALAAVAALALAACGGGSSSEAGDGASAAPETMRIAFQTIPNGAPIVKQQKWLEEALPDTTIEWKSFASGAEVNQAVTAGEIDAGLIGSSPATNGVAKGLGYKVVWIYDVLGENEALVVKKSSRIASLADLKGKKIGTPFGSTTHYSLLAGLEDAGVDPAGVTILDMQPQDAVAAWQSGNIDGAYVWVPFLAELRKNGGTVILSSADMAEKGALTADVGIVATEFADSYPDAVKAWLSAENRAVELYQSDPAAAAAAVAKEFSLPPADAQAQMKELVWVDAAEQGSSEYLGDGKTDGDFVEVMKKTAEFLVGQEAIPEVPDDDTIAEAVDGSYLPTGS
jgi:taurine transport system substrate-binding protein